MHPVLYAVHRWVTQMQLLDFSRPVLLALSTGPDSVFLYHYLKQVYTLDKLYCVYFNHQCRRPDALEPEIAYMMALKQAHPKTVFIREAPVRPPGIEVAARKARYDQMQAIARKHHITQVCTAHHYDDHIETVLMKLIRGSQRGLGGIRPQRPWPELGANGTLSRPLLQTPKAVIHAFLDEQAIAYCHDHTNNSRQFTRNRVRHDLIPLLTTLNPAIKSRLAAFAVQQAETQDFLAQHHQALHTYITHHNDYYQLSRHDLCSWPTVSQCYIIRVLADLVATRDISYDHIRTVQTLCNRTRFPLYTQWPGGIQIHITRAYLRVACI